MMSNMKGSHKVVVAQRQQATKETETFVDASQAGKGCHLAAEFAAFAAMSDKTIGSVGIVVET